MTKLSPKWIRIFRTANLYFSFFGLGLCVSITGPTLLDLEKNVGTDTEHMSYMLAARSASYLAGSVIGGLLLDRFNRQLLLILCIIMGGASTLAMPWWKSFYTLTANVFVGGLFTGALDTGNNVWCLDLWQENSAPFMQALHCMFGLGAFAGPLIAEPFLSKSVMALMGETENSTNLTAPLLLNFSSESDPMISENTIVYCYSIASLVFFLAAISFIIAYCCDKEDVKRENTASNDKSNVNSTLFVVCVMSAVMLMMGLYGGVEFSLGQLLTIYSVMSDLHLSKNTGSFITSVFWGGFTFFRGFGVITAMFMKPSSIILMDYIAMTVSGIIMVMWSNSVEYALWFGAALYGIGMASAYPAVYAFLGQNIFINNRLASCFTVAGVAGEMSMPIIIAFFIETRPMVLPYCVMVCTLASFLTFVCLWSFLGWRHRFHSQNESINVLPKGFKEADATSSTPVDKVSPIFVVTPPELN